MPDAAAMAIAHPRIHNGRPIQKPTTAEIAEESGDAPKGHRVDFATYRKRARPQLVKTLIATVERFTDSGNAARTDISGFDVLAPQLQGGRKVPRGERRSCQCEIGYLPTRPLNSGT